MRIVLLGIYAHMRTLILILNIELVNRKIFYYNYVTFNNQIKKKRDTNVRVTCSHNIYNIKLFEHQQQ
jgi:hypothetical protein